MRKFKFDAMVRQVNDYDEEKTERIRKEPQKEDNSRQFRRKKQKVEDDDLADDSDEAGKKPDEAKREALIGRHRGENDEIINSSSVVPDDIPGRLWNVSATGPEAESKLTQEITDIKG